MKRDMDLQIASFLREEGLERKHKAAVEELQVCERVGGFALEGWSAGGSLAVTCTFSFLISFDSVFTSG